MTVLELSNVSKRYGDRVALEPMDLALAAARTYVLLGPSGCGKSTVLKLALRLLKTDTGCVRIHGEELNVDNVLRLRQRATSCPKGCVSSKASNVPIPATTAA